MKSIRRNFLKPFLFVCFGLMIATIALAGSRSKNLDRPDIPGKPEAIEVYEYGCKMQFTAPIYDGGFPIISYIVEYRDMNGPQRWIKFTEIFPNEHTFVYVGARPGQNLQFRIKGVNEFGVSDPSEPSNIIPF